MNQDDISKLDLEDILKEFHDDTQDPSAAREQEVSLDQLLQEFGSEEPQAAVPPEAPPQEPAMADTIRMAPIGDFPKGQVHNAAPVEEDSDSDTKPLPSIGDQTTQWEPDYEQPMGSFTPAKPILVHPQSRLRELKRKLVAGPEKRYYELAEKGLGKLQLAILISFLLFLASAAGTVFFTFELMEESRIKLVIFSQLFCLLLCAILGSFQLIDGMADLFHGKPSMNTLLVFSLLLCGADAILCLQQLRLPFCAAFCLQTVFSLWSAYHERRTEMGQCDTLRRATNLTAVRSCGSELDSSRILLRDDGRVEDYEDYAQERSTADKVLGWYSLAVILAAIGMGIWSYFLYGVHTAVQIGAVTLLAGAPASGFICQSRPKAILEKRLRGLGTVLGGWSGIRQTGGKVLFPIVHSDLFPAGMVKMNGVKFFGQRSTDEVVAYATAVIHASDNGLSGLFEQVLESRNCRLLSVENLRNYDGGVGGEVLGEPVLIGTLPFLRTMGVEVPDGLRVTQAVCVAIDGELSGLFAITYEKNREAAAGLATLNAFRNLSPILTTADLLLSEGFLQAKFGIRPRRLIFADQAVREQLSLLKTDPQTPAVVLTTKPGLAGLAFGITGARALRTACILGAALQLAGGLLGIAIIAVLVLLSALGLLTPLNLLLLQMVWVIPSVLITEWSRVL